MDRKCSDRPEVIGRWFADPAAILPELEITKDVVWLSRASRFDRRTIRGVPAKRVDVLVQEGFAGGLAIVEVARKAGRFDGAARDRITIRDAATRINPRHATTLGEQMRRMGLIAGGARVFPLSFERSDDGCYCRLTIGDPADPCWHKEWGSLRWTPESSADLRRIVEWHASRYYRHLSDDQVDDACAMFVSGARTIGTLAERNREASRALYEVARQAGWRKLTLREQGRLGLTGQWHRDEVVLAALAVRRGCAAGVGEATLRAGHCAAGDAPEGFDPVFRRAS